MFAEGERNKNHHKKKANNNPHKTQQWLISDMKILSGSTGETPAPAEKWARTQKVSHTEEIQ
jgi:hypothetical protein